MKHGQRDGFPNVARPRRPPCTARDLGAATKVGSVRRGEMRSWANTSSVRPSKVKKERWPARSRGQVTHPAIHFAEESTRTERKLGNMHCAFQVGTMLPW